MELGGPDSADPLNEEVIAWWKEKMKEVFARIPNLGGFLGKGRFGRKTRAFYLRKDAGRRSQYACRYCEGIWRHHHLAVLCL